MIHSLGCYRKNSVGMTASKTNIEIRANASRVNSFNSLKKRLLGEWLKSSKTFSVIDNGVCLIRIAQINRQSQCIFLT